MDMAAPALDAAGYVGMSDRRVQVRCG